MSIGTLLTFECGDGNLFFPVGTGASFVASGLLDVTGGEKMSERFAVLVGELYVFMVGIEKGA